MPSLTYLYAAINQKKEQVSVGEIKERKTNVNLKTNSSYTVKIGGQEREVRWQGEENLKPGAKVIISETDDGLHMISSSTMQARTVQTVNVNG